MKTRWLLIISLWVATAIAAVLVIAFLPDRAYAGFGAIAAGSVTMVTLLHLIKASPQGYVKELIYVSGGSYLILGVLTVYLFLAA